MSTGTDAPFGFNIIGMSSADLGLGLTARQFARVLLARGYPVCILDIDAGHGRSGKNNEFAHITVGAGENLPYAVNLFVEGAHILPEFILRPPRSMTVPGRLNVGFLWWELTVLPEYLRLGAEFFDVLMVGSEFVQSTMGNHIPRTPVLLAEHPLSLPAEVLPNRARFGLPQDAFVVGMSFDPLSDPARKNPFAALEAFRLAFTGQSNCHLVVKMSNPRGVSPKMLELINRMKLHIEQDERMHLIEETLPYDDLLSLYASYDVFISLHRSEGLGLGPLEAMLLGKPVVATAWSGNLSYMSHENACLVAHDLVPVNDDSDFFGPEAMGIQGFWADPLPEHAAAWLRKLQGDPEFRKSISLNALRDARAYQARAEQAGFVSELEAIWNALDTYPTRDRPGLKVRVAEATRQNRLRKMSWGRRQVMRLYHPAEVLLDRHVFWRFRSRRAAP